MTFVTFLKTCKIVTFPSVWNDFDHFCSHTLSSKSTFYLRRVTKTAFQATSQLQIPMEQRDSTPPKHHSETANPNGTTTQTCHLDKTLHLYSEMHHLSCLTCRFYANHKGIAAQSDTFSSHKKSPARASPNDRANCGRLRTVANGCGRLRTVAVAQANFGEHTSNPQTPNL